MIIIKILFILLLLIGLTCVIIGFRLMFKDAMKGYDANNLKD